MPITITCLSKEFHAKKVLEDVTTSLPSNDITVIIGKNGSGKSTLLNCIGGLLTFESGKIDVEISATPVKYNLEYGNQIRIPKDSRIKIGHIFQQKVLWNHLSVFANIVHPLTKVHKLSKQAAIERAKKYLNLLDLEESLYKKYPTQL